jgi:hypothetical protein
MDKIEVGNLVLVDGKEPPYEVLLIAEPIESQWLKFRVEGVAWLKGFRGYVKLDRLTVVGEEQCRKKN